MRQKVKDWEKSVDISESLRKERDGEETETERVIKREQGHIKKANKGIKLERCNFCELLKKFRNGTWIFLCSYLVRHFFK